MCSDSYQVTDAQYFVFTYFILYNPTLTVRWKYDRNICKVMGYFKSSPFSSEVLQEIERPAHMAIQAATSRIT